MADAVESRKALGALLLQVAEAEKLAEVAKQVMLDVRGFSSAGLFRRLTAGSEVRFGDLWAFLRRAGADFSETDARELFEALDRDCDGALAWTEFLGSCVSREFSPEAAGGAPHSWAENSAPGQEAETALLLVFAQELEAARRLELARRALPARLETPELEELFEQLDAEQKGYLSLVNLWNFLKRETGPVSLKAAERCFRRLDRDADGRIALEEWLLALAPRSARPQPHTLPRDSRLAQTLGFNASSTASDLRASGRKHTQTVRSTADKTFSATTRARGFGLQERSAEKQPTPHRVVTTEVFNYFEDDVAVEKEVTTKITRALPFDSQSEDFASSRKHLKKHFQSAYRFEDDYVIHEEKEDPSLPPDASRLSQPHRDKEVLVQEPPSQAQRPPPQLANDLQQGHSRSRTSSASLDQQQRAQVLPKKLPSKPREDSLERPAPSQKSSLQVAPQPPRRPPSKPAADRPAFVQSEVLRGTVGEDFKRYLKPSQQKSSQLEQSTQRFSQLSVGGRSLQERYRELNARRDLHGVTLERNAMRGVLKKPSDAQEAPRDLEASIFERKHLPPEVPRKTLPRDFERTIDTTRKSDYEKNVLEAARGRAGNAERLAQFEKNSSSHFDISEGRACPEPGRRRPANRAQQLSWGEKDRLARCLAEVVRDFRLLEQKRISLAMRFDLKLEELFQLADDKQVNSLSPEDFCRFLDRLEVDLGFDDALFLFSVFDRDRDRFLDFEEFVLLFAPFHQEYRDALIHKSNRRVLELQLYDRETLKALRDCIATVFNVEKNLAHYKQELDGRLYELFDLIDAQSAGSLTLQDFKDLSERKGFFASREELEHLLARLQVRYRRLEPATHSHSHSGYRKYRTGHHPSPSYEHRTGSYRYDPDRRTATFQRPAGVSTTVAEVRRSPSPARTTTVYRTAVERSSPRPALVRKVQTRCGDCGCTSYCYSACEACLPPPPLVRRPATVYRPARRLEDFETTTEETVTTTWRRPLRTTTTEVVTSEEILYPYPSRRHRYEEIEDRALRFNAIARE